MICVSHICLYIFKNVFLFCIIAGHPKYKDNGHKFQLWSVKATELDITEKALMTWWQNQRTKYGRLTRSMGASGSGRKDDSGDDIYTYSYSYKHTSNTHPQKKLTYV